MLLKSYLHFQLKLPLKSALKSQLKCNLHPFKSQLKYNRPLKSQFRSQLKYNLRQLTLGTEETMMMGTFYLKMRMIPTRYLTHQSILSLEAVELLQQLMRVQIILSLEAVVFKQVVPHKKLLSLEAVHL